MVSGGTVTSDLSSLKTCMTNYTSEITGLSGAWQGDSYNNLVSKAEQAVSEFGNALEGEMTAFASACDLYKEYEQTKINLSTAQSNYNTASSNKDSSAMTNYGNQVASYQTKLGELKTQIEGLLASAAATSLSATSSSGTTSSGGFTAGKSLGIEAGTYEYTFTSSDGKQMKYYAYIPNNATEGMPLILYLHGDGSVNNMKALKDGEMARFVPKVYGNDAPFIYIQPMTEVTSWEKDGRVKTVAELVQDVAKTYHCDTNKIILTGHSRGGNGSWAVANQYPNLFSCFVPISGRANIDPNNFKNLPTIAISSPDSSDSWNYGAQKKLVDQINAVGGDAKFISQSGTTHASVCKASYTEELYNWMISQTRKSS